MQSHSNNLRDKNTNFVNPINSQQKAFLGKKFKVSTDARATIDKLPRNEKLKLSNNINRLATEITTQKLHRDKSIYFKLSNNYLKLTVESSNPPYLGTIKQAKVIAKPKPLRPKPTEKSHPLNCGIRNLRGLAKELVNTPYHTEKVVKPNLFTAEQLVDIQVRRMRKRIQELQSTRKTDPKKTGHNNTQWAEVTYGAEPFFLGLGTGEEMITLSGIYGVSGQTGELSKTFFGSTKQSKISKTLHNYAVILGHPLFDKSVREKNIQLVVSDTNLNRAKAIKHICDFNYRYQSDVIIQVDSDLNIHKFFRNGQYQFVECK